MPTRAAQNALRRLLGTELPLIQAPMAGVQGSTLAVAVSNVGALGSLPCAMLTVEAMRTALARLGPHGLLFITRPEAQLPRLLSTVASALGTEHPKEHVIA